MEQNHWRDLSARSALLYVVVTCYISQHMWINAMAHECLSDSFPDDVDSTEWEMLGDLSMQQPYVLSVFDGMKNATKNCDAGARVVQYESIGKAVFLEGVRPKIWKQEEQFGFNNARTLVNLLAAAPPQRGNAETIDTSQQCSSNGGVACPTGGPSSNCQCAECNIWFNDIFLDTLLQSAVESHSRINASGMCLRNSPYTAQCRDVTIVGGQPTKQQRDINLTQCSEPWLWRQPNATFSSTNLSSITIDQNVSIVPHDWTSPSNKYTAVSMPRLKRSLISWSTVHAQCLPRETPNWVHISTVPLIAICSKHLVSVGMCSETEAAASQLVMVGSSWIAVSLNSYDIKQCSTGASSSDDVFVGSALCSYVHAPSRNYDTERTVPMSTKPVNKSMTCTNIGGKGFSANSYSCGCPVGSYYKVDLASNTSSRPSTERHSYPGDLVSTLVLRAGEAHDVYASLCAVCDPGCNMCQNSSTCKKRDDNQNLRIPLLVITLLIVLVAVVIGGSFFKTRESQLLLSSVSFYLQAILLSAMLAYLEAVVLFPKLDNTICALQPWPRHLGFVLVFGFLFAKLWRVQVLARMPPGSISPGHLDRKIVSCVLTLAMAMVVYLVVWTIIHPPKVEIMFDSEHISYLACSVDWWRYSVHGAEIVMLLLACLVARKTRQLVLEWPEFKFISLPFLNAVIIKSLIAIFYFTLMPDKYSDHLYLLQFFEMHFTITSLLAVLCGHKLYFIVRGKEDRDVGPTVPSKSMNPNSPSTSSPQDRPLTDGSAGNEIRRDSGIEVTSIADYQQQQLQVPYQQDQDSPHVLVVPGKVSLRDVLLSCLSGTTADDWEATDTGENQFDQQSRRGSSGEALGDSPNTGRHKQNGVSSTSTQGHVNSTGGKNSGDGAVPRRKSGAYGTVVHASPPGVAHSQPPILCCETSL